AARGAAGRRMAGESPRSLAIRATARPWLPSVAATSRSGPTCRATIAARSGSVSHCGSASTPAAASRSHRTRYVAHEAPRILKAGSPMRLDSSLTSTPATAAASAKSGMSCTGVGAYPGSRRGEGVTPGPGRASVGSGLVAWFTSSDMSAVLPARATRNGAFGRSRSDGYVDAVTDGTHGRLRQWLWSPPRGHGEVIADRTVSSLELFYDLVYVAVIGQAAHHLADHVTAAGVVEFTIVFGLVWAAWVNGSLYLELHGREDGRTRSAVFLQMGGLVLLAVFTGDAAGDSATGFALVHATFLGVMTWLWYSVRRQDRL